MNILAWISGTFTEGTTKKDRLAIVYMPLIIVVLTFGLGTGIGIWFQNRSFKHNELFRAKLDRVMAAQKEVVEIMAQVDLARKQIRSNEDFIRNQILKETDEQQAEELRQYYFDNSQMGPSLAILKETWIRLDALGDYSASLTRNAGINSSVEAYHKRVTAFIACVENNRDFSKSCSDEYSDIVESLRIVLKAHAHVADELIHSYE